MKKEKTKRKSKCEKDSEGNTVIRIFTTKFFGKNWESEEIKETFFDEGYFFGEHIFNYYLYKVRGYFSKEGNLINLIFSYRSAYGELITPRNYIPPPESTYTDFILNFYESLMSFKLEFDETLIWIEFTTNLGRIFSFGKTKNIDKIEASEIVEKNPILLAFFGATREEGISYIGSYYMSKRTYVSIINIGLLFLKFVLINKPELRERLRKEIADNKYPDDYCNLLKICLLPEYIFYKVLQYYSG